MLIRILTAHTMWYAYCIHLFEMIYDSFYIYQKENAMGKAVDIDMAISDNISQTCDCEYSNYFITNGRLLCGNSKKEIIYQALLLTTDGKTAEEIRTLLQEWVLTKPFITVNKVHHQLDPYCSVVIHEIGDLSCDPIVPTLPPSGVGLKSGSMGYVAVVVTLLLSVIIATVGIIISCYALKKYRLKKAKEHVMYANWNQIMQFTIQNNLLFQTPGHHTTDCV